MELNARECARLLLFGATKSESASAHSSTERKYEMSTGKGDLNVQCRRQHKVSSAATTQNDLR